MSITAAAGTGSLGRLGASKAAGKADGLAT